MHTCYTIVHQGRKSTRLIVCNWTLQTVMPSNNGLPPGQTLSWRCKRGECDM